MNEPITDPVEQRRVELIERNTEKTRVLQKHINSLKHQAMLAEADADREARNYRLPRANALRADAMKLRQTATALENVELPKLRIEAENIRQYRTPEMSALMTAANLKARNSKEDQARNVANTLVSARAAFEAHVAKLATKQTFELAKALADAAAAASAEPGDIVRALLAAREAA